MLEVDPAKRITISQALQHKWFKKEHKTVDISSQKQIVTKLSDFNRTSLLQNTAVNILIRHLSKSEVENLQSLFEAIDTDGSGSIEVSELKSVMKKVGNKKTEKEL